jgi:hypothetical protein
VYYGVYELRLAGGRITDDPVVATATTVQGAVSRFISDAGPWAALGALVVLVAVGVAVRHRRVRRAANRAHT